ncbi:MAG: serine/threonine-protein kinase [Acidobacteriota bacterium]
MMIHNRYEILGELGQGAMGTVFHAFDHRDRREVALKRALMPVADADDATLSMASLPTADRERMQPTAAESPAAHRVARGAAIPEGAPCTQSPGSTADRRLALVREYRLLRALRHPNIIRVMEQSFDPCLGLPFYTMERLRAPQTLLEAAEGRSLEGKVRLLMQLLEALEYLHGRGVIHRDIKPSNALVEGERLTLVDFGIAELREKQTGAPGSSGTLSYMAPELHAGQAASEASDLFAVGVIAYQMLTGRHPYKASSLTLMMINVSRGRANLEASDLEPRLVPVLRGLLAAKPASRFRCAARVKTLLASALEQRRALPEC